MFFHWKIMLTSFLYKHIRVIPHFPKPGIMFQDITPLLLNHKVFKGTVDIFVDRYKNMGISVVAVDSVQDGDKAVVIDDLVATGGTLSAAIKLLECMGAEVVECSCVIGVPEVKGQNRLNGKPLYMLVEPTELEVVAEDWASHVWKG